MSRPSLGFALLAGVLLAMTLGGCRLCVSTTGQPCPGRSMKGYGLYSWQDGEGWRFSLLVGTNRLKTYNEVTAPDVVLNDVDAFESRLRELLAGEFVFWSVSRVAGTALPPEELRNQVVTLCEELDIDLHIAP